MLGGKVDIGLALAEQLDRITVFVPAKLINTVNESDSLENIRQVIREELQEVSFAAVPPAFRSAKTELTEEEQVKNEKSVLDVLEMFG